MAYAIQSIEACLLRIAPIQPPDNHRATVNSWLPRTLFSAVNATRVELDWDCEHGHGLRDGFARMDWNRERASERASERERRETRERRERKREMDDRARAGPFVEPQLTIAIANAPI
jgi:hypothetical protein